MASLSTVDAPEELHPIFARAEEYISQYFGDMQLNPATGTITISGQRYTLVRSGAMSSEFFDVVHALYGAEASEEATRVARSILFDMAHAMGLADARVCRDALGTNDPVELLSAGPVHFAHAGWAFVKILPESKPSVEDYLLVYDHPYSFESDSWLESNRTSEHPVCIMNAGYSSGWCETSFGQTLVATEITCRAKGDPQCRFVMAPPHRVEDRVKEYLEAHPQIAAQASRWEVPGFFARKTSTERLQQSADQLGEYSAELELRVQERTAELTASNRALTASEQLNQSIQEVMPGAIVRVSIDGTILSANAEGLRILGLSKDELTGKITADFDTLTIYEDGSPASVEEYPVSRALMTGEVQGPTTLGVQRPDGHTSWAVFRAAPIKDAEGAVTAAVVTFFDITERKAEEDKRLALEAQMQEAQRLESLGVLAGGIAHDFNNLLVGILGHASLVSEALAEDSPLRDSVGQIELAASRAADLARQMLAYTGRGQRDSEPVDLSALSREMLGLVRASVPKGIDLWVNFAQKLPLVEGDPAQLRQVIMNLIINAAEAFEATAEGRGTVRITTGVQTLDADALETFHDAGVATPGPHVYVAVSDDGAGMAPETVSRMFDPFFTTKSAGRGLGLASVRGIVRAHSGALNLTTTPGQGATIEVYLPVSQGPPDVEPDSEEPTATTVARSGAWLIVDDEPIVRRLATRVFEALGFEVIVAEDGQQGVAAFEQHRDTVTGVLLDVTMPVMNGVEALERIRAIRPDVPAIISSGYDGDDVIAALTDRHRLVFLPKPFRIKEVRDALATLQL